MFAIKLLSAVLTKKPRTTSLPPMPAVQSLTGQRSSESDSLKDYQDSDQGMNGQEFKTQALDSTNNAARASATNFTARA
jgi:hypothetical protein